MHAVLQASKTAEAAVWVASVMHPVAAVPMGMFVVLVFAGCLLAVSLVCGLLAVDAGVEVGLLSLAEVRLAPPC